MIFGLYMHKTFILTIFYEFPNKIKNLGLDVVVITCNPSYSGGRDLRLAWEQGKGED
jgi:hypothetical protein